MRTAFVFKCRSVVVKGMLSAVLTIGLVGPSTGWTQAPSSENWEFTEKVQKTVQWEGNDIPTDAMQLARAQRPASTQESPEEIQMKKAPKPVPSGQARRISKQELIGECEKDPKCRAKLQAAKSGKPPKNIRPAQQGESPEEKAMKQIPKPADNPSSSPQKGSHLLIPEQSNSLLSWLNPFQVSNAFAQTDWSRYMTPTSGATFDRYGRPLETLGVYCATTNNQYRRFWLTGNSSNYTCGYSNNENKPYIYFRVNVPSTSYYIISFQAGKGKAKLRHQYNGPIIDTWDTTSRTCSSCNYATLEYLAAGGHSFYFWPNSSNFYFYSATIERYP